MVAQHLKDGLFVASDLHKQSAGELLGELQKWAQALSPLRGILEREMTCITNDRRTMMS